MPRKKKGKKQKTINIDNIETNSIINQLNIDKSSNDNIIQSNIKSGNHENTPIPIPIPKHEPYNKDHDDYLDKDKDKDKDKDYEVETNNLEIENNELNEDTNNLEIELEDNESNEETYNLEIELELEDNELNEESDNELELEDNESNEESDNELELEDNEESDNELELEDNESEVDHNELEVEDNKLEEEDNRLDADINITINNSNIKDDITIKDKQINNNIDQGKSNKKILMGISPKNIVDDLMNSLSDTLPNYYPVDYNIKQLNEFIQNKFNNRFIIPKEPFLLQRIAIYSQLYIEGGLFINPANIRFSNANFENMCNLPGINIYFILDEIKSKKECMKSVQIHPIRKNTQEREVQVSSYFIYSKITKHDIFLDILRLVRKRYNQTVPRNEYIESITKYGKNYLVGSDILNEVIYNNNGKYKDVVILKRESYKNYLYSNV